MSYTGPIDASKVLVQRALRRVATRPFLAMTTETKVLRGSRPRVRTVLIADDDPIMARRGGHLLYEAGIEYMTTTSLATVVIAAARGVVGAVLLDYKWPSGDPVAAMASCRDLRVPVAFWTAYGEDIPAEVRSTVVVIPKWDDKALLAWAKWTTGVEDVERRATMVADGIEEAGDSIGDAVSYGLRAMGDRSR